MYTTLIDSNTLLEQLNNPDWRIFDTRYDLMDKTKGKQDYQRSHIPGAIYLDLHDDLSGPPVTNKGRHPLPTATAMQSLFSKYGIQADTQVVVYDSSCGAFAARLWWMLQHMQHPAVAVLDGGWQDWLLHDGPQTTEIVDTAVKPFSGEEKMDDVIDIDQVGHYQKVFDSREPPRYRGEYEPIDKAAGHIPGARNRFWKENLAESGQFKDRQVLREEFEVLFEATPAAEVVFYCGSGVTACHNLLAVRHAGLSTPKLYAGSWSEWSRSPGRPVATGSE